jgi:site-specific DNA-cytosine methylase
MNKLISMGVCDGISCIQPSFKLAGITDYVHISVEKDPKARKVVAHNFPNTHFYEDVRDVRGKDIGWVDFFSAGPSCKNISAAGGKKGLSTTTGIPVLNYDDYVFLKSLGHKFTESCLTFFETIRIYRELRDINPNISHLFENVVNNDWE